MIFRASDHPFYWSLRRRRLWENCRRAYFLHYYASGGGFSPDESPEVREFHRCRALLSVSAYRNRLLGKALRDRFYRRFEEEDDEAPAGMESPGLSSHLLRRFRREFYAMLRGEPERDHKLPMLAEVLQPGFPVEEFRVTFERELRDCARKLEKELLPELERFPFSARRRIASPLPVQLNELAAYAVPLLAVAVSGELWIFENGSGEMETALLHKFYALNELSIPPERVRSFRIDFADGVLEPFGSKLNISDAWKQIRRDVDAMLALIHSDGTVVLEEFPGDRRRCGECVFRNCCPPEL